MLILRLLIFTLPWIVLPNVEDPHWEPKQVILTIGLCAFIALHLFRSITLRPMKNIWVGRFLTYALLWGTFCFWGPYVARHEGDVSIAYRVDHWVMVVNILLGFLLVRILVGHHLLQEVNRYLLTKWVCYSTTLVALYAILEHFHIEQFFVSLPSLPGYTTNVMHGAFGNFNLTACYLGLTTPLFFVFKEKKYLVMLGIVLLAICWMPIRFVWIAVIVSLFTYSYLRLRKWIIGKVNLLLILLLIGGGLWGSPHLIHLLKSDERWPIWCETIYQWKHYVQVPWVGPLTGVGPNNFAWFFYLRHDLLRPETATMLGKMKWITAHNEPLQVLFEYGVIGLGLLGFMVWTTLKNGWRQTESALGSAWFASGIALCIISCCNFPFHIAPLAFHGLLIWSMNELTGGVMG